MRFAVLVPVYNHGGTVARVVRDIAAQFVDSKLIVINDGSSLYASYRNKGEHPQD